MRGPLSSELSIIAILRPKNPLRLLRHFACRAGTSPTSRGMPVGKGGRKNHCSCQATVIIHGVGLEVSKHPRLEIRRIPWGDKGLAEAPDLLIRIEPRAEVIPALQRAFFIDRAQAFFIQERTRMRSCSPVNLQVHGLSGVRKSSAALIDLVFKRTFFTGIHLHVPGRFAAWFSRCFFLAHHGNACKCIPGKTQGRPGIKGNTRPFRVPGVFRRLLPLHRCRSRLHGHLGFHDGRVKIFYIREEEGVHDFRNDKGREILYYHSCSYAG